MALRLAWFRAPIELGFRRIAAPQAIAKVGYMEDAKRWGAHVFSHKLDVEPETGSSTSGRVSDGSIGTPIARSKNAPDL